MHHFEIGNEIETHHLAIVSADRNKLAIDMFGHMEYVATNEYVAFARKLTDAFHRLEGRAELINVEGKSIMTLTFLKGRVEVQLVRGKSERVFHTDQSYVTPTLAKIGVIE